MMGFIFIWDGFIRIFDVPFTCGIVSVTMYSAQALGFLTSP